MSNPPPPDKDITFSDISKVEADQLKISFEEQAKDHGWKITVKETEKLEKSGKYVVEVKYDRT